MRTASSEPLMRSTPWRMAARSGGCSNRTMMSLYQSPGRHTYKFHNSSGFRYIRLAWPRRRAKPMMTTSTAANSNLRAKRSSIRLITSRTSLSARARGLRRVLSELITDIGESGIDVARDRLHAGGGCQGDQRGDQRVLDQILTLFVAKDLCLHIEL